MKKILIAIFTMTISGAYAEEYGTYVDDDFDTYDSYDTGASYSNVNASTCDCACDRTSSARRDNYTGFRLYKNEHSAYSYNLPNGHKEKYLNDNFAFGSVLGNNLTTYARVEYETMYMGKQYTKNAKSFDYDVWGNFLNVYLMHRFDGVISPYIGAGIGISAIWGEMDNQVENSVDLSYQLMAGVLFELNNRIELDLGFKYINFGKVEYDVGVGKIDATQLYLGASYKFSMN